LSTPIPYYVLHRKFLKSHGLCLIPNPQRKRKLYLQHKEWHDHNQFLPFSLKAKALSKAKGTTRFACCHVICVFCALLYNNDRCAWHFLSFRDHQPCTACNYVCVCMVPDEVNMYQMDLLVCVSHSYHTTKPITSFIFYIVCFLSYMLFIISQTQKQWYFITWFSQAIANHQNFLSPFVLCTSFL